MLTVVTPATNKRLTTVSAVREELGLAPAAPSDATIERWIDQASQAIVDYCGREFAQQTYREAIYFTRCSTRNVPLLLARDPVTAITSANYAGAAVTADGYIVDGEYFWRKSSAGRPMFWGPSDLIVEYKAGYKLPGDGAVAAPDIALPATVEQACLAEIKAQRSRAERDPLVRSESEEGVGSTSWQIVSGTPDGPLVHPDSAGLLARYRRLRVR